MLLGSTSTSKLHIVVVAAVVVVVMLLFAYLFAVLVDPGKLTFNFDRFQEHGRDSKTANATHNKAVGVVTVKVKGQPPSGSSLKDLSQGRCVTLRLGKKKYKWPLEMGAWQATYAFLVHDLNQEVVCRGVACGCGLWVSGMTDLNVWV